LGPKGAFACPPFGSEFGDIALTAPTTPPPGSSGWNAFLASAVPIGGLVTGIAAIIITYQVSRIGEIAGDIKNTNGRIDQIYPLIATATGDIGAIKGSLEVTSQRIAIAVEKNENLQKRLEALVSGQELQAKNIHDMSDAITKLADAVSGQQQRLTEISNKIGNPLVHKNSFFMDSTIFSPKGLVTNAADSFSNVKVVITHAPFPSFFTPLVRFGKV
jgi:uncharacterized coiled-coil protein SlyX